MGDVNYNPLQNAFETGTNSNPDLNLVGQARLGKDQPSATLAPPDYIANPNIVDARPKPESTPQGDGDRNPFLSSEAGTDQAQVKDLLNKLGVDVPPNVTLLSDFSSAELWKGKSVDRPTMQPGYDNSYLFGAEEVKRGSDTKTRLAVCIEYKKEGQNLPQYFQRWDINYIRNTDGTLTERVSNSSTQNQDNGHCDYRIGGLDGHTVLSVARYLPGDSKPYMQADFGPQQEQGEKETTRCTRLQLRDPNTGEMRDSPNPQLAFFGPDWPEYGNPQTPDNPYVNVPNYSGRQINNTWFYFLLGPEAPPYLQPKQLETPDQLFNQQ
jgi:hypothetical protein